MKFSRTFRPENDPHTIIRKELHFVLEPQERWFKKQLRARLLDEGCNLPMVLAKPRFYTSMLSETYKRLSFERQQQFQKNVPPISQACCASEQKFQKLPAGFTHAEFYEMMRMLAAKREDDGQSLALAVTASITTLCRQWELDEDLFHLAREKFIAHIRNAFQELLAASQMTPPDLSVNTIASRLYLAFTTSLLHTMNVRQEFELEFTSIPVLLQGMRADHREFCRFMVFCQERHSYFQYIVSRTFWRILETLRLEHISRSTQGNAA